jgi:hypothetical protein
MLLLCPQLRLSCQGLARAPGLPRTGHFVDRDYIVSEPRPDRNLKIVFSPHLTSFFHWKHFFLVAKIPLPHHPTKAAAQPKVPFFGTIFDF